MQAVLKMTSKRQVTFPAEVCRGLGVQPGETILLESREIEGKPEWVLRTSRQISLPWFGVLKSFASGKSHDLESIRKNSVRRFGRKRG